MLKVVRDPGKPGVDKLILIYKPTHCKNAYDAFRGRNDADGATADDGDEEKNGGGAAMQTQRSMIALIAREPPQLASADEFTVCQLIFWSLFATTIGAFRSTIRRSSKRPNHRGAKNRCRRHPRRIIQPPPRLGRRLRRQFDFR